MLSPVTRSYLEFKIAERQAHYDLVQTYRDYTAGDQAVHLTDDQKILIVGDNGAGAPNSDPEFKLNVCSPILDAEVDRLEIQSIKVTVPDNDELSDTLSSLAWKWFKASRMDEGQQNAHFAAARDGDSFGFVYRDEDKKRPALAINPAYDGENGGADLFYQDDDPNQPLCAVKIWAVDEKVRRKNIYYPDRVEMWINTSGISGSMAGAGWRPLRFTDDDYAPGLAEVPPVQATSLAELATVAWWTANGKQGGVPLGLPVFHFRHQARGSAYGRSTIADVAPGLQDAINRSGVSLLAASQLSGFKTTTATGINIDRDRITNYPGSILFSEDKEARFGQLGETNLMQLVEVKNTYIKDAATLTNTPLSFFNLGGQAPAEGSQKALELGLLAKTRRNQTSFGNTWEDMIRYMFRLESVAKGGVIRLSFDQIDALEIDIVWEPAEVKNDLEDATIAEKHKGLGVPQRYVWQRLGYSEDQITEFEQEADTRRNSVMGQLVKSIQEAENGANAPTNRQPVGASNGQRVEPA